MVQHHKLLALSIAITTGLVGIALDASAAAGKVSYSIGDTAVFDSSGARRAVKRGDVVDAGDRLVTENGRMQVRFEDGGMVALQPRTEFTIEAYDYAGKPDGNERSFFSLLRGGIRAVTGAIGGVNRDRYQVRTAFATIGVRGTTYKARVCNQDCTSPDGLYAKGGEGQIVVANEQGEVVLSRGQSGYVAGAGSAPGESSVDPDVADVPAPAADDAVPENVSEMQFVAGQAVFQKGTVLAVDTVRPIREAILAGSGTVEFDGEIVSGAGVGAEAFAKTNLAELNGSFNSDNALVALSGENNKGQAGAFSAGNVVEAQTDGILYLGRWTNGTVSAFADGGFSEAVDLEESDSVHYLVGIDDVVVPGTGQASYTFNGLGTSSTGSDGSIGAGITGGQINVDFGLQNVDTQINLDHGGEIAVSTYGDIKSVGTFFTNGFATGAGCSESCSATVDGFLSGKSAVPERAGAGVLIEQLDRDIVTIGGFSR